MSMFVLVNSFNFYLEKVNSLDTYLGYGVDKFALIYGRDKIFPNRDLVVDAIKEMKKNNDYPEKFW